MSLHIAELNPRVITSSRIANRLSKLFFVNFRDLTMVGLLWAETPRWRKDWKTKLE